MMGIEELMRIEEFNLKDKWYKEKQQLVAPIEGLPPPPLSSPPVKISLTSCYLRGLCLQM